MCAIATDSAGASTNRSCSIRHSLRYRSAVAGDSGWMSSCSRRSLRALRSFTAPRWPSLLLTVRSYSDPYCCLSAERWRDLLAAVTAMRITASTTMAMRTMIRVDTNAS